MSVYFIKPVGMDGPIKIGCSEMPVERADTLAAWSPFPLEIVATIDGSFEQEGQLHRAFSHLWSHGEWFRAGPDLIAAIERLKDLEPLAEVIDLAALKPISKKELAWQRNPEARERFSYYARLNGRWNKLGIAYPIPSDVKAIMRRWSGTHGVSPISPTMAERARLDEAIAEIRSLARQAT